MSITVEELEQRQRQLFEQRSIYEEAKARSADEYSKLTKLQQEHIAILETLGKDSYKCDAGLFSFKYEENYKVDPEREEEFREYIHGKGLLNTMLTFNPSKVNAWAKAEAEAALESGVMDLTIPGLIKSEPWAKPSMRKA